MPNDDGSSPAFTGQELLSEDGITVALTYEILQPLAVMAHVKSPKAGAVVLFAGTTRDNLALKTVSYLAYSAYAPLALRTMLSIARQVKEKHALTAVSLIHRLGRVDVCEESILIAVSSPHRQAAWAAGEEMLERVKQDVEVWKMEQFADGGVWRANRDGAVGAAVEGRDLETYTAVAGNRSRSRYTVAE